MPTDEELLDFDKTRLADWNEQRAQQNLTGETATLYRNHLEIARWIDGWIERMKDNGRRDEQTSFDEGFQKGIREIAAHLRQGDFVPGGALLDPEAPTIS